MEVARLVDAEVAQLYPQLSMVSLALGDHLAQQLDDALFPTLGVGGVEELA